MTLIKQRKTVRAVVVVVVEQQGNNARHRVEVLVWIQLTSTRRRSGQMKWRRKKEAVQFSHHRIVVALLREQGVYQPVSAEC